MSITKLIADQFRQVYSGGNWTAVNFKDSLNDVDWEMATTKVNSFNTIAVLVFHTNYYVRAVLRVLKGEKLEAHDKFSFDLPEIKSQKSWEEFLQKIWNEAQELAGLIEQFPEEDLPKIFTDEKYGTYYRNFTGIIEHNHYHLGQIVLLKKILQQKSPL